MPDSATVSATVSQYSDFISLSDMLVDTAIDGDIVAKAADQLGYRAGTSVDNIIRAELDSVNGSVEISAVGDYFSGADLANFRTRMAGLNIKGLTSDAFYTVLAHPYVTYDLIHDPMVGGFKDIVKQTGDVSKFNMEDRGFVCRFNNCEVWETTNTTVTAGSPNTYRAYGFGQEGVAAIDLAGRGPSRTMDQDKSKFKVYVSRDESPSIANPEGKIKAFASYNFVFVVKNLDTNPYRHRQWDFASSLGL
jgi:N4-gp56 family major capsid protein